MGILKTLPLEKPGVFQGLKLFDDGNEPLGEEYTVPSGRSAAARFPGAASMAS